MKLGQTSVLLFISKIATSLLGFIATIYFARVIGAGDLGIYFLTITVVSWLGLLGTIGFRIPTKKRISESTGDEGEYVLASLVVALGSFLVLAVFLVVFRDYVSSYIGMDVVDYVIVILLAFILFRFISAVLQGQNLVHLFAGVRVVRKGSEVFIQLAAVMLGFSVVGLLVGYASGALIAVLIGALLVSVDLERPKKSHFVSLYSYAKYSWIHSFQGRTFSYMDTLVLGFFVTSNLVGIYQIAWQLASFLVIFGNSIAQTLFPEISEISSRGNEKRVANLFKDSVAYTGLFIIPGLIGGVLLGDELLLIYGAEFRQGTFVLTLLLFARLIYAYQTQIINTINAIDKPDLGFRVNVVFVAANMILNVVLVYTYGWEGAAMATTISAGIALLVGYYYIVRLLPIEWPIKEMSYQWGSALVMGGVVYGLKELTVDLRPLLTPTIDTVVLVGIGGVIYFGILMAVSEAFRSKVQQNAPL